MSALCWRQLCIFFFDRRYRMKKSDASNQKRSLTASEDTPPMDRSNFFGGREQLEFQYGEKRMTTNTTAVVLSKETDVESAGVLARDEIYEPESPKPKKSILRDNKDEVGIICCAGRVC